MTPPERLQVGPYSIALCLDEPKLREYEHDNGWTYGYFDRHSCEIVIDPTLPHDLTCETILHELQHMIDWTVGVQDHDKRDRHQIIRATTALMLDTLRRNPELVAFLLNDDTAAVC